MDHGTRAAPDAPTRLSQLAPGRAARIRAIDGDAPLRRRLLGLGLRVGSEVRALQRRNGGVVVACNGNRVALGNSIAERLDTEPL